MTLDTGVSHGAGNQADSADRVVVAGYNIADLIGIAVGIYDGHDREAQLVGLGDSNVLLAGINDKQRTGELVHVLDTAHELLQLLDLELQLVYFLLGQTLEGAVLL